MLRLPELPADAFEKEDKSSDHAFYAPPRFVVHLDEGAVNALTRFYRDVLPSGGAVLDLMSSWVSHLPEDRVFKEVIGHGMNASELAANPRLSGYWIQDLNRDALLPHPGARFDAATCCVGVQYLQDPLAVFAEVRRVLKPGAPFVVSFSNRCFPTKAVRIWLALNGPGRARLITLLLARAGFVATRAELLADGLSGDPLAAVVSHAPDAPR